MMHLRSQNTRSNGFSFTWIEYPKAIQVLISFQMFVYTNCVKWVDIVVNEHQPMMSNSSDKQDCSRIRWKCSDIPEQHSNWWIDTELLLLIRNMKFLVCSDLFVLGQIITMTCNNIIIIITSKLDRTRKAREGERGREREERERKIDLEHGDWLKMGKNRHLGTCCYHFRESKSQNWKIFVEMGCT